MCFFLRPGGFLLWKAHSRLIAHRGASTFLFGKEESAFNGLQTLFSKQRSVKALENVQPN